jgi:hypothetical protein
MKPAPQVSDTVLSAKGGMRLFAALSLDNTLYESFREMHDPSVLEPERALLYKVIEDALEIFTSYRLPRPRETRDKKNRRIHDYREVRRWIFDDVNCEWVFSFQQCCEWLDIHPQVLRERCRRYDRELESGKKQKTPKHQRGLRHDVIGRRAAGVR